MGKVRNQPKTSGKLKFPFVDIDKGLDCGKGLEGCLPGLLEDVLFG